MKIIDIEEVKSELIETDQEEYPFYRRSSAGNWENLMGGSWEVEYFCEELEAEYQKAKVRELTQGIGG
ncbi:hypothetical protein LCGC14_2833000 [marine sediment metagenome]|uniref:Uncharacterized protein n=1 Tax=marine sediment metagenome TaxID=412755 RepID=A0A0F8Z0A9_9ZZZZ